MDQLYLCPFQEIKSVCNSVFFLEYHPDNPGLLKNGIVDRLGPGQGPGV